MKKPSILVIAIILIFTSLMIGFLRNRPEKTFDFHRGLLDTMPAKDYWYPSTNTP